ncbi:MAG: hypothetical protein K6B44_01000 [Lachnospiraceae bacterium]|nr:hypothetical protein [Lachnospiraceae bacterium]
MTTIEDLIEAIAHSDKSDEEKDDIFAIIKSKLNCFMDYVGHVISTEVYKDIICSGCSNGTEEYMYKKTDEYRSRCHDECIIACKRLNEICDSLGIDHFCNIDTDDRHEVAKFVGKTVTNMFATGIKERTENLV